MQHTQDTKKTEDNPLFNANQHKPDVSRNLRMATERHALRTLYFARIMMNEIDCNNKHFLFSDKFKDLGTELKSVLSGYHKSVSPMIHPKAGNWLLKNLDRDAMGDLAHLVEAFSQMDFPSAESMFESIVGICTEVIKARKMHKSIDVRKYDKILQMFQQELQADLTGGRTTFNINKAGTLTINLGQAEVISPKPKDNERINSQR